jgi:tetratricopeptide (TPR) repeat protein
MKVGQFIGILAIAILIAGFIPPVMAANETVDAATNYYNMGNRLLGMNEYARAVAAFDQALASNTTIVRQSDALLYIYQGKAFGLIKLEQYENAIRTVEQGLAIYPKDPMLWNDKGYALFMLGRYQDAVTAYDSAISFDPNYTSALINKGQALYLQGKYQDSADAYMRADATDPGNSEAAAGLAKAQTAAASAFAQMLVIVLGIIVIIAAGAGVWYFKFRKPAEEKTPEQKSKKAKKK